MICCVAWISRNKSMTLTESDSIFKGCVFFFYPLHVPPSIKSLAPWPHGPERVLSLEVRLGLIRSGLFLFVQKNMLNTFVAPPEFLSQSTNNGWCVWVWFDPCGFPQHKAFQVNSIMLSILPALHSSKIPQIETFPHHIHITQLLHLANLF